MLALLHAKAPGKGKEHATIHVSGVAGTKGSSCATIEKGCGWNSIWLVMPHAVEQWLVMPRFREEPAPSNRSAPAAEAK